MTIKDVSSLYVIKLDEDLKPLFAKTGGNISRVSGHGITVDSFGNYYIMGIASANTDFGAGKLPNNGLSDIFIMKNLP